MATSRRMIPIRKPSKSVGPGSQARSKPNKPGVKPRPSKPMARPKPQKKKRG